MGRECARCTGVLPDGKPTQENIMTEEASQQAPAAPAPLPPFYRNPVPIDANRHAKAGLRPRTDVNFARDTNAIVLTVSEFAVAARFYPIVFTSDSPAMPFAVVGLRDRENLFLDAEGRWEENTYIPAYVRRYPFIFSEVPGSTQLVLCVDEGAEHFESESAEPFFVNGKPSVVLERALKFSETFQADFAEARRFGEWLDSHGMLEEKVARTTSEDGQQFTLRGFRLIDPEKMRTLEDGQVLELHKKGWLPLIHFHMQSLQNLGALGRRLRATQPESAAAS